MNRTAHFRSDTDKQQSRRAASKCHSTKRRLPYLTPGARATAALGAGALLVLLGALSHSAQAVTCGAAQRGTLEAGNTFTAGTTDSHNDYRVICTGDASGQKVTQYDLAAAFDHEDADDIGSLDGRLVVQLHNAHLDTHMYEFPLDEGLRGAIVVLGSEGGASNWNDGIEISVGEMGKFDFKLDSHATISTTGGAKAIEVWTNDESHYSSRIVVRNFGSLTTTGGGSSDDGRSGDAILASSRGGIVYAINEASGTIVIRGPGGNGITAANNGSTATAINRGSITTHGNPVNFNRAYGISALTGWGIHTKGGTGFARATNEGTVTTHGLGAPAVAAFSGSGVIPGLAAVATNKGTIETRGNTDSNGYDSAGLFALSYGGTAQATNESDATIHTYGIGARGLSADNWRPVTGRAEAENRGTVMTSGHGMDVWSEYNSAYAVNHNGATITTTGQGATGVQVSSSHGSADESAYALNRGTITTSGDGYHTDHSNYNAIGMVVYSAGEAPAIAVNMYEGVIETSGTGAKGIRAVGYPEGAAAVARNLGRITTRGDAHRIDRTGTDNDLYRNSSGMQAISVNSDAAATNETGGVIETHGARGIGFYAWSGSGTATAVNRGRVTTRGGAADDLPGNVGRLLGANGVQAHSEHANARVENGPTGRVDTYGERAFALFAETEGDGSRTSAMAEVVNRSVVHTRGRNADAVLAGAIHGGTADNPNRAHAINTQGAAITTVGDGATGLGAFIQIRSNDDATSDEATDAYGTVYVRNDGTVITGEADEDAAADDTSTDTTTDDEETFAAGVLATNGVAAAFYSPDDTTIGNAGDVTVVNTGDVTVKLENATGLYAETHGDGTATVQMLGGTVRAEHETGRGLWARTGDTGEVHVTIAGGAKIAASSSEGIAAELEGETTNLRLLESTLDGRAVFGSGTDTFTIRDGRVTGAIDFGTGTDTLNVHGDTWLEGAVSNLEALNKRGSGNLVMRGDAAFSSGGSAVLENGGLMFAGQFNLGTTGTMRVHDAARLTAVLADASAPPQITAGGGIIFDGDEELFLQVAPGITATSEQTYLNQLNTTSSNPIANGTPVTGRTGQVALRTSLGLSTVVDVGHIPLQNGNIQVAGTSVTAGVRLGVMSLDAPSDLDDVAIPILPPGGPSLALGGGVAGLGALLFSALDSEVLGFADEETGGNEGPTMPAFVESRERNGGLEYWARAWASDAPVLAGGAEATVRGSALGVDMPVGEGFRLGVSTAPEMTVSSGPLGRATPAGARLDGARYAAWSNWRGEIFHAGANASHGRYRAQSILDNPVAGGGLGSEFDLTQDHVQLGAGARLTWSGVQAAPSLSVFSGALRRDAHTAEGAVFRADVPGFSQRYSGWKSEITVSPKQWLPGPGTLRWRPALHLHTQRTHTAGPASLELAQHDKAGVLSLTSSAEVSGLPGTVHGFSATVDALRSDAWQMQLGFAGMQADGDYKQMMLARLRVHF